MKVCPQCESEYAPEQMFCPRDGAVLRAADSSTELVGTIIAERYLVLQKLGEGGMGEVYLAEHVRMGRKSAVKVIRPALIGSADPVARFTREARNASRIDHPNVAAIYDFGETSDGLAFLAMEFVEGEPISTLIAREGPQPVGRAAAIVGQVASALTAAHELEIVHRDLKPDNIMLARHRDGGDRVKVVDFGIAKTISAPDQKVTATGVLIGTPAYMSPEQLTGEHTDGRSDEYALALVAVELLTGQLPFSSGNTFEVLNSRFTEAPKRLGDIAPDVAWPEALDTVLQRALSVKPESRYQTVKEFGEAFQQACESAATVSRASAATLVLTARELPSTIARGARDVPNTRPTDMPARRSSKRRVRIALAAAGLVAVAGGALSLTRWGAFGAAPAGADSGIATLAGEAAVPAGQAAGPDSGSTDMYRQAAPDSPLVVSAPAPADATPAPRGSDAPASEGPSAAASRSTAAASAPVPSPASSPAESAASTKDKEPTQTAQAAPAATEQPAPLVAAPAPVVSYKQEIARLQQLAASDEDPTLQSAIALSGRLLPLVTSRTDSLLVHYSRARAFAGLGADAQACQSLAGAEALAAGTSMLEAIRSAAVRLNCR